MSQSFAAPSLARWRTLLALGGATMILHLVLIQPNHPAAMTWGALWVFPLELPVLLLGLVALPRKARVTTWLRLLLVLVLTLIAVLKFADFASFSALSRGFNPVADIALVEASARLASGTFGFAAALALSVALIGAIAALAAALWWATGVWARVSVPRAAALGAGAVAVLVASAAVVEIGGIMGRWTMPFNPPGAAFTARVGAERVHLVRTTLADLRDFTQAARTDPLEGREGLFERLDRDLLVIFIESYGRGSLDNPLYADLTRDTLAEAQSALEDAGFAIRSGWLDAPTRGGQSWLSHMTLASGLRTDAQSRYAAALASDRKSLYHLAQDAGIATAAAMPAITLPWPEGALLGFDRILAAADLGYRGKPFNWVTMPDQFTLSAVDRLLLDPEPAPLVAQIALISSHAPWVPVPDLVPWDDVGDGTAFDAMADAGDPPNVVWRDRDRVRQQYALSVDYALRTAFAWAARKEGEAPLMLILGDHQPAEFVAGDRRTDVPAHLIGPAGLVAEAADWGWIEGLIPDARGPVDGMEGMRDRLVGLVSAPAPSPPLPSVRAESAPVQSGPAQIAPAQIAPARNMPVSMEQAAQ